MYVLKIEVDEATDFVASNLGYPDTVEFFIDLGDDADECVHRFLSMWSNAANVMLIAAPCHWHLEFYTKAEKEAFQNRLD